MSVKTIKKSSTYNKKKIIPKARGNAHLFHCAISLQQTCSSGGGGSLGWKTTPNKAERVRVNKRKQKGVNQK